MKRDPTKLADRKFDLLVIGAGVNGACIARDAAMRGLSVALVDRGDFVSATSFNSLRIVHGGLRYLQHLDFRRMRQSIRERTTWLRIAPHLVHCLAFMAPTTGRTMRSRSAFRTALWLNDRIGWDRNRGLDQARRIPPGRVISRDEALTHYPGVDSDRITGGAMWYDAQMYHSERLVLAVLASAVAEEAQIANYLEVTKINVASKRITGASVRDVLTGDSFDIRAGIVVNAGGSAVDSLVKTAAGLERTEPRVRWSKAMNILTPPIAGEVAVGVPGRHLDPNAAVKHGARLLFITPWRGLSLIGTTHSAYQGPPGQYRATAPDVADFVDEINWACPRANLALGDVRFVYSGLLPSVPPRRGETDVRLLQHHRIIDHRREDGLDGFISLVAVKYTTARLAAQEVVDLVLKKADRKGPPCRTAATPLDGGGFDSIDDYVSSEIAAAPDLNPDAAKGCPVPSRGGGRTGPTQSPTLGKGGAPRLAPDAMQQLIRLYGTHYGDVLALNEHGDGTLHDETGTLPAQVRHAVRSEMAVKLGDAVFRRTDLASRGDPGDPALIAVARTMAAELGWDDHRINQELDDVRAAFGDWKSCGGVQPQQPISDETAAPPWAETPV